MVIRKSKLKISIKELSFEFEGSQEEAQAVQQGIQQTLGSLMNTQSRLLGVRDGVPQVIDAEALDTPPVDDTRPTAMDGNGDKPKPPRQRRAKAESPTALVREMKAEGFFTQARSLSEIQEKLKLKGHTVKQSTISARLQELTKKKELFRDNGGEEGSYVYKDTPFNESPGSSSPPDQPAE